MNDLLFQVSGENFEEILKEMGVNVVLRKIAKTIKPRLIIDETNGKWSFTSASTFKTMSFQFTPGIEFEDVTPDGQQITV